MKLIDITPFIRYAAEIKYNSPGKYLYVRDCRLFYILSGRFEIFTEDKHYILDKNDIFYCRSGSKYKICGNAHIISVNFDLSTDFSEEKSVFPPTETPIKSRDLFSVHVDDSYFLNSHFILKNGIKYKDMIDGILHENSSEKNYHEEMASIHLKYILTDMHRPATEEKSGLYAPTDKISEYIKNNFSKNITNKELASFAGYHEYYLNRIFTESTGISMHQYLINTRMNEARKLILNTDIPLKDISETVGFNNYTYFSNYFKTHFGSSPSRYRQTFKNNI